MAGEWIDIIWVGLSYDTFTKFGNAFVEQHMLNTDLNIREIALLAAIPIKQVKKHCENEIVKIKILDGQVLIPNDLMERIGELKCPREFKQKVNDYVNARTEYVLEDEEILGGTPVIKGTRINVHSIRGRLEGGDSLEDLVADYPNIPPRSI